MNMKVHQFTEAFMEIRNKEIEGEFSVSDGGGGSGYLRYIEPPED